MPKLMLMIDPLLSRLGMGIDFHEIDTNRKLFLGGIEIPCAFGLQGHSDADVLVHSIIDACLGAMAKGDIGQWFPQTDPKYKDICSLNLLTTICKLIKQENFIVINIDTTIIAEEPKLAPYIKTMRKKIARVMDLNEDCVSIKATTSEGLLFNKTDKKGMAAYTVVLMTKIKP